jgi:mRNA degradation ribonuclease J1/J2
LRNVRKEINEDNYSKLLSSKTSISFYGGVHEIGGNKFLVEDRGTKIFLDFGMQMGKANQYFAEFVSPRTWGMKRTF